MKISDASTSPPRGTRDSTATTTDRLDDAELGT